MPNLLNLPGAHTLASVTDEPILDTDPPPETRGRAVCGTSRAPFGFGPRGTLPADAWYRAEPRQKGEQAWAMRYGTLSQSGS